MIIMARKGDAARESIKNTIIKAFGDDFVAVVDKKLYVQAQDGPGGEVVQFAISLTMPKVPVISDFTVQVEGIENTPMTYELTTADKAEVQRLKTILGV